MRIRAIKIKFWRHFRNIKITIPDDAKLVCLVGANGTGKSMLLELIASCAHRFGLSPGIELHRGDPFNDPHDFEISLYVAPGVSDDIDKLQQVEAHSEWDRILTITSRLDNRGGVADTKIVANNIASQGPAEGVSVNVSTMLQQTGKVHFLLLDADRAYPNKPLDNNELAQAYRTNWDEDEHTRQQSFRLSRTLYDEWKKYFLGTENQASTKLIMAIREARSIGKDDPSFKDHFDSYQADVKSILPYVTFRGVDTKNQTILFDTAGVDLPFDQLSGGEREVAFLVGQIDRFGLRQGLLLLDEPELHLNADLIRSWVTYLTGTVQEGQVWLATHSLEAVEAAVQEATFVLERAVDTQKVDSVSRLSDSQALSALSRAVGTPAFSLSRLRFVFVEGDGMLGEHERYRMLTSAREDVRFMACGSCNEVSRRVDTVRSIAEEAGEQIIIGGIIDRDFRQRHTIRHLEHNSNLHVLKVHEVENFYLHPETLSVILQQNGRNELNAQQLIMQEVDSLAGSWVFQYAWVRNKYRGAPNSNFASKVKERIKSLCWQKLCANNNNIINELRVTLNHEGGDINDIINLINISLENYRRLRNSPNLWKYCEGKQVLSKIAKKVGYANAQAYIKAVAVIWERDDGLISPPLRSLRNYIGSL